jgi:hypothetical protein
MLSLIIITAVVIATALSYALRGERKGGLIVRRPYNNRYNAASGARDDSFV